MEEPIREKGSIPPEVPVSRVDRALAIFNGGLAGLALLIVCGMAILPVLMVGAGDGPGWGGIGVGIAIGRLISGLMLALVTVVPLSIWLLVISKWLLRGDSRGRRQLLWVAWIVAGATLLLGAYAWLLVREPIMYVVLGFLPAIYASLHLVSLDRSRRTLAASGFLIGTIVLSIGTSVASQMAIGNRGRIPCDVETHFGATILTSTGHVVCIGNDDATREFVLGVWSFQTGKQTLRKPFTQIDHYDLSQAGNLLAVIEVETVAGSQVAELVLYDIPACEHRTQIPNEKQASGCAALKLSPKGDLAAVGYRDGTIQLYALPIGRLLRSFQAEKDVEKKILNLAFDPHGEYLAVASAADGTAAEIALWPVAGTAETPQWRLGTKNLIGMSVNAESSRLILFTNGELLSVDLSTGKVLTRYPQPPCDHFGICAGGFSSDGRQFGLVQSDGKVTLWDTNTGEIRRTVSTGQKISHDSAAINLDSMLMITGRPASGPGIVWLSRWNLAIPSELRSFK